MLDLQVLILHLWKQAQMHARGLPGWGRKGKSWDCLLPSYFLRIGWEISLEVKQKSFQLYQEWSWHWIESQRPGRLRVHPEEFSQVKGFQFYYRPYLNIRTWYLSRVHFWIKCFFRISHDLLFPWIYLISLRRLYFGSSQKIYLAETFYSAHRPVIWLERGRAWENSPKKYLSNAEVLSWNPGEVESNKVPSGCKLEESLGVKQPVVDTMGQLEKKLRT